MGPTGRFAGLSVVADAGTIPVLCAMEVASRTVRGRAAVASEAFDAPVRGVLGRELIAEGVVMTAEVKVGV